MAFLYCSLSLLVWRCFATFAIHYISFELLSKLLCLLLVCIYLSVVSFPCFFVDLVVSCTITVTLREWSIKMFCLFGMRECGLWFLFLILVGFTVVVPTFNLNNSSLEVLTELFSVILFNEKESSFSYSDQ